jgi:hypothetical protein
MTSTLSSYTCSLRVDETKEYCKVWLAFKEVGTVACSFFVGKL